VLGGVPVVVITAAELTDEDRERLNGGVERILQRSEFQPDDLLAEVRTLVARSFSEAKRVGPQAEVESPQNA
jgi:hypothetical protein